MNTIKSLIIHSVSLNCNADKVIEAFYCNDIATISRVSLLHKQTHYSVLVDIAEWHETEAAYSFVKSLLNYNQTSHDMELVDETSWDIGINPEFDLSNEDILVPVVIENSLILPICDDDDWQTNHWDCVNKSQIDDLIIIKDTYGGEWSGWHQLERELDEMLEC